MTPEHVPEQISADASVEATEPDSSAAPTAPTGSKASGRDGIKEWFWRGRALEAARERAADEGGVSGLARERLRRARLAAELADYASGYDGALRAGSALPLALSLYRQAAYWALVSRSGDQGQGPGTLAEAFQASPGDLSETGFDPEQLQAVRKALVEKSFVETADDPRSTQRREADLAQRFVAALIEIVASGRDPIVTALAQRWLRIGIVLLLVAGLIAFAALAYEHARRGPDLAAGKSWRASSQAHKCRPRQTKCGGVTTSIFFHTRQERKPWVEIDLGKPMTFARFEVENRDDCCRERAVPLLFEVSEDRKRWVRLAHRRSSFRIWKLTFDPVRARYIRLRVDRRSILHLVRVSVWAR